MTLYKSFNRLGSTDIYPQQRPVQEEYRPQTMTTTPITDLPMIQQLANPQVQGFGGQSGTAIRETMLPDDRSGYGMKQRAQNLAAMRSNMISDPSYTYEQEEPVMYADIDCKQFNDHVENCSRCYKLYRRNHRQGALIIFLVFIIVLLIIQLIDKSN